MHIIKLKLSQTPQKRMGISDYVIQKGSQRNMKVISIEPEHGKC